MDKTYTKLVSTYPLFSALSSEEIAELVELFSEKAFEARDVIVKEGDPINAIYFIVNGMAEVRKAQQPVASLGPWDSIGLSESGFFSSTGQRTATVTALTPVTSLCLDLKAFDAFLKKHPLAQASMRDKLDVLLRKAYF